MSARDHPFDDPRTVLARHGLSPKRSWGQSFLVSARALEEIARLSVDRPGREVVEIGAGVGTLTARLLSLGGRVAAVERDPDLCAVLEAELGGAEGFRLVAADAASLDYGALFEGGPGAIAGNIPYQITGRILRAIMGCSSRVDRAVLTVQLEVAARLTASPGGRERGALTAMIDARFAPRLALRLPPSAFHPRPKVRSAVVELVPRAEPLFAGIGAKTFDSVVKAAFTGRRKTLRNSLIASGAVSARGAAALLSEARIDPGIRAERLETGDLVALARAAARSDLWASEKSDLAQNDSNVV